ncbi:MAG: BamA/TamA family outer membrane protein, partial [bacterium]
VGFQAAWADLSTPSANYTLMAGGRDRTLTASLLGVWDTRDYVYYPRRGSFFQLAMEQTRWVDTSYAYFQHHADLRAYFPFQGGIVAGKLWATIQNIQTPLYRKVTFPTGLIRNGEVSLWRVKTAIAFALEYRFTLIPMFYVSLPSLPWIGDYTERLPFGVEGLIFWDRGNLWKEKGIPPHQSWAIGGGFHFRVPYLEIISVSWGWGPTDRFGQPNVFIANRLTF